jgi:hypothetical protein
MFTSDENRLFWPSDMLPKPTPGCTTRSNIVLQCGVARACERWHARLFVHKCAARWCRGFPGTAYVRPALPIPRRRALPCRSGTPCHVGHHAASERGRTCTLQRWVSNTVK